MRTTAELDAAMEKMLRAHGAGGASASGGGGSAPAPPPANEPTEEEVQAAFAGFDPEQSGAIATASLDGLMQTLGLRLNEAQLAQAKLQLDRDNVGAISYGEFLLWWKW